MSPYVLRNRSLFVLATSLCFASVEVPAPAKPPVIMVLPSTFAPSSPVLPKNGEGLCAAYAEVPNTAEFNLRFDDSPTIPNPMVGYTKLSDAVNLVMDAVAMNNIANVTFFTHGHPFDFSNYYVDAMNPNNSQLSARGDYVGACVGMNDFGCFFNQSKNPTTPKPSFISRYRGYMTIPPDWTRRPLYFGMTAEDAGYLQIFDRTGHTSQIIFTAGPGVAEIGRRITNQVTFSQPGIYPVEIGVYKSSSTSGAFIELVVTNDQNPPAIFATPFEEVYVQNMNPRPLSNWPSFFLLQPTWFFQSPTGDHAFKDGMGNNLIEQCQQCPRQYAGTTDPNTGCATGFYCNTAALCDLCNTAEFCGSTCMKCGGSTPICDGTKCVECAKDADCGLGQSCVHNSCQACTTDNACAGNSCNCCPGGTHCTLAPATQQYICGNCKVDADCPDGKCDPVTLHCVQNPNTCPMKGPNLPTDQCGTNCEVSCPADRPLCENSVVCVQCRSDLDCGTGGSYCSSGVCETCTTDRRCGLQCRSCGGKLPFCSTPVVGGSANSQCVECLENSHCGPNGVCNQSTHTCAQPCTACQGQPGTVCNDTKCVQCVSSSQCPCGGTCDSQTGQCTTSCRGNEDCSGSECCSDGGQVGEPLTCHPGHCVPGLHPGGGLCGCNLECRQHDIILADRPISSPGQGGGFLTGMLIMLSLGGIVFFVRQAVLRRRS